MPAGLPAVNVCIRLVLSGPDRRRGGLQLTRPGHPCACLSQAAGPMALLLGYLPGVEQVELDSAGDAGDAGLAGLAGREVAGLLGFPRAGPAGAAADEVPGHEDLQQERGERV